MNGCEGLAVRLALVLLVVANQGACLQKCKRYEKPRNGFVVCDSLFHLFCSVECNKGFIFTTKPALVYMCGPTSKKWFTYPHGSTMPWPDCVPDDGTKRDNIKGELEADRAEILHKISATNHGFLTNVPPGNEPEERRFKHLYGYMVRAYESTLKGPQAPQASQSSSSATDKTTLPTTRYTGNPLSAADQTRLPTTMYTGNPLSTAGQTRLPTTRFTGSPPSANDQNTLLVTRYTGNPPSYTGKTPAITKHTGNPLSMTNQPLLITRGAGQGDNISSQGSHQGSNYSAQGSPQKTLDIAQRTRQSALDNIQTTSNQEQSVGHKPSSISALTGDGFIKAHNLYSDGKKSNPESLKPVYSRSVGKSSQQYEIPYVKTAYGAEKSRALARKHTDRISPTKQYVQNTPRNMGDHLFFFPIKRDTLLQLLPKPLQKQFAAMKRSFITTETKQAENTQPK